MRLASLLVMAFSLLGPCRPAATAEDDPGANIPRAFTKAWEAKRKKGADSDEIALYLYREAWLPPMCFLEIPRAPELPEDTPAEEIIAGQEGGVLHELTRDICYRSFTERPNTIVEEMKRDYAKGWRPQHKVASVLSDWPRYLYRRPESTEASERRGRAVIAEDLAKKWSQVVEGLLPFMAEQLKRAEAAGDKDGGDLIAQIMRDLGDPRAIPVLLGKDGRNLRHNDAMRSLQRNRKADPMLVGLLADPDEPTRWRATLALTESRDPALEPHALRLLRDPSPRVREDALLLACFLPDTKELREAMRALLVDKERKVRCRCASLLASKKDLLCAPVLLELLRQDDIERWDHFYLVQGMRVLAGTDFGYRIVAGQIRSEDWRPTTEENLGALARFAQWIEERKPEQP